MFAPIYHAAWERGIAPEALDRSPLYVVDWMLRGIKDPNAPETAADLAEIYRDREDWIAAGNDPDDFYVPDDRALI